MARSYLGINDKIILNDGENEVVIKGGGENELADTIGTLTLTDVFGSREEIKQAMIATIPATLKRRKDLTEQSILETLDSDLELFYEVIEKYNDNGPLAKELKNIKDLISSWKTSVITADQLHICINNLQIRNNKHEVLNHGIYQILTFIGLMLLVLGVNVKGLNN